MQLLQALQTTAQNIYHYMYYHSQCSEWNFLCEFQMLHCSCRVELVTNMNYFNILVNIPKCMEIMAPSHDPQWEVEMANYIWNSMHFPS